MSARLLPARIGTAMTLCLAVAWIAPANAQAPQPLDRSRQVILPANPETDAVTKHAFEAQGKSFAAYLQCIAEHRKEVDLHYAAHQVIQVRDDRTGMEAALKREPSARHKLPGGVEQLLAQAFSRYKAAGGTAASVAQVQPVATPCPPPAPRPPERAGVGGPSPITQSRESAVPPAAPESSARAPTPDLQTQDPAKQVEIGIMYRFGRVPLRQESKEAERWFRKAASSGYPPALNALGDLFNSGAPGFPRDAREAAKWYRQAADKGNADAMVAMGNLNSSNQSASFSSDDAEAVRWFRKAGDLGHVMGMYHLARAYQTGKGIGLDKNEALNWYRKAAEKGNAVSDSWVKLADNCARQGRPPAACL